LALPLDEIHDRVDDALELFGITHLKENHPAYLSGGEAQKVALASAAAMRPRLLLLDEAFSRIASADVPVILERLRAWSKRIGAVVLLLERRGQVFERFCDRVGCFRDGVVLECDQEAVERSVARRWRPEAAPSLFRVHTESFFAGKRHGDEDRPCCENVGLEQDDSEGSANRGRLSEAFVGKKGITVPREERPALLRIRNLDFRWKGRSEPLLRSLNAELRVGERAALVGPNGAGKSTLMRLCAGLLAPERGEVLLGDAPVLAMRPKERAARVGFLFQDAERQIFHSTVAEEVLFSLRDEALSPGERMERLNAALCATGLRGKEKKHPLDLNAAERRMVAVASIAVRGAELLLLDEPSRDFDPQWRELFEEWLRGQNAAVLAISHDPDFVERLFPRVWSLNEGWLLCR
jgi:energy-coupling factor transport system ATP-binding protein